MGNGVGGGPIMRRAPFVLLLLACALPTLAAYSGPYEWSAEDQQTFMDGCRTLTPKGGLCECMFAVFKAHYPSIEAFQKSREKDRLQAVKVEWQRCADRYGEK